MSFVKHVAIHNQRKAIVLFREVPGEDHMCLISYSDDLPRLLHDELMKCVESSAAQDTVDLADVAHRHVMADGRLLLDCLHNEHRIKKVPNNQVLLTPNSRTRQRLDEVNVILRDIAAGDAAAEKRRKLDEGAGMSGKPFNRGREVGEPPMPAEPAMAAPADGALSDADIAKGLNEQAKSMEAQAKSLMEEAKRLKAEAKGMTTNAKKTTTRGRPKKASGQTA